MMTKLATICYIDNGEALLLLHRNKSQMMFMKENGFQLVVSLKQVRLLMNAQSVKF